jgi:uncharacterized membrane protein YesL
VAFPELMQTRLFGQQRIEQISTQERISGLRDAWQVYKNNWFLGTGPGNYTLALHEINPTQPYWFYQPVHNAFLLAVIELGVLSFILCSIFFYTFVSLFKKKYFSFKKDPIFLGFFIGVIALALIGLFDHYLHSLYFGLMISFIVIGGFIQGLLQKKV